MITETKEIYKCEHCRKLYQSKHFALRHEQLCPKNPDNNRACFGCVHLGKRQTKVYHDVPSGGEQVQTVEILHCAKKSVFLYPPKVEVKKNMYDLGDDFNEPMPKECEMRQDILNDDY